MGIDRRLLWPKILCAVVSALVAGSAAWWIYAAQRGEYIAVKRIDDDEEVWRDDPAYAVDPEVGHRAARNVTVRFSMGPIGGSVEAIVRHSNNHGFLAEEDYDDRIPSPRIVVLGDSHVMGVVSTVDNVGPLLQRGLRSRPGLSRATVMNAGTGFYSLYQYLLRARQLLPRYRPQVLVVVVFLGNDFLDLEDQRRPHLTDDFVESPISSDPPAETTSARQRRLDLPAEASRAFWQGLNQAAYLFEHPDRRQPILRKADHTLQALVQLCRAQETRLLVALLPSFDLVFPEQASLAGDRVVEVVASGVQRDLHRDFLGLLERHGVDHVDLLPIFRGVGKVDLYAHDFHIWKRGHATLAEAVLPRLLDLLSR